MVFYTESAICSKKLLTAQVLAHLGRFHFQIGLAVCVSPIGCFELFHCSMRQETVRFS